MADNYAGVYDATRNIIMRMYTYRVIINTSCDILQDKLVDKFASPALRGYKSSYGSDEGREEKRESRLRQVFRSHDER